MIERFAVHQFMLCILIATVKTLVISLSWNVTPPYADELRNTLFRFREALPYLQSESNSNQSCGIMWTLASVNGSRTDFKQLTSYERGVGKYRLLTVIFEVFISAARVRNALMMDTAVPEYCSGQKLQLTLFTDRNLLSHHLMGEVDTLKYAECLFDRIIYFDDLPLQLDTIIGMKDWGAKSQIVRLPPRTNVLKLTALLASPYTYTLYLDGDTAPCKGFQMHTFQALHDVDLVTSKNPFGFVSTENHKVYPGAPPVKAYASFEEINGGVIGLKWTNATERFLVRSLELVPFFGALGYDQDQAFMRHALFEMLHRERIQRLDMPMNKFCRFGWSCTKNSCQSGCLIIHQRKCNYFGVSWRFAVPAAIQDQCGSVLGSLELKLIIFSQRLFKSRQANKRRPAKKTALAKPKPQSDKVK